ncbi:MAG: RIP metalloprotease RseP [Bacteroidetes bacterium]|nr:RIP metalloprotease RseP [Bacteroidota bacterium]
MGNITMIGQLIAALAILVTLHELGHFLAARAFGIKVEKFYLFFDAWGIKLFKFKKGETEYGIGWLPLGGYVKIAGMIDESLDTKQLKSEPQNWEFRAKPAWQRLIVMVAGVFVNLVLGIFLFSMGIFSYGDEYLPMKAINDNGGIAVTELGKQFGFETGDKILAANGKPVEKIETLFASDIILEDKIEVEIERNGHVQTLVMPKNYVNLVSSNKNEPPFSMRFPLFVDSVMTESPAHKAGLQKGDKIKGFILEHDNVVSVNYQDELSDALKGFANKPIMVMIQRNNSDLSLPIQVDTTLKLGFFVQNVYADKVAKVYYRLGKSFELGTTRSFGLIIANAKGLGQVITGKIKAQNALQGPVAIATYFGKVWDWQRFWNLTAILSLILAFMNLLPIPALDGGHVFFLIIEMIIGRPINEKIMHAAQVAGMILLLALMVFVIGNDIFRLFK